MLDLVDPETGSAARCRPQPPSATRYAAAARDQRPAIARDIRGAGADHLVLRTDRDWLLDIVRFVARRRERLEKRKRAGR